jgi:hypothetical protein
VVRCVACLGLQYQEGKEHGSSARGVRLGMQAVFNRVAVRQGFREQVIKFAGLSKSLYVIRPLFLGQAADRSLCVYD